MMTLDSLRLTLSSPDPDEGMDRLIRAELDAGRTTAAVHADLPPLVKPARRAGLAEDADEALLGALDALTRGCHPDCRFANTRPSHLGNGVPAPPGVPADALTARQTTR